MTSASFPGQKGEYARNIEKYLREITLEFLYQLQKPPTDSKKLFIDILIKIFGDIISHPYIDRYRIIDANYQPEPILFKKQYSINFFRKIGFIEENNGKYPILLYPYSAPIPPLAAVQNALRELGKGNFDYVEKVEIMQITDFATFVKFQGVLEKALLNKEEKMARIMLGLNLDELRLIFAEHHTKTLQQILLVYYRDPKSFEKSLSEIISTKRRAEGILSSFKEFWLEAEFLRFSSCFVHQCFTDKISKSFLNDTNDTNSQIARRILGLSILQAQTLVKISEGKTKTIKDIVLEYMRWQTLSLNNDPDHEEFEERLGKCLLGKEKVKDFMENLDILISERITFQTQSKSVRLKFEDYRKWCSNQPFFDNLSDNNFPVNYHRELKGWFQSDNLIYYYYITQFAQRISKEKEVKIIFDKALLQKYLSESSKLGRDALSKEGLDNTVGTLQTSGDPKIISKLLYRSHVPASLYAAILNKHLDILKEILKGDLQLNLRDSRKRTLLHYAAFAGETEITSFLIEKGLDIYAEDDFGKTAFDVAYESQHYKGIKNVCAILVKSGINPPLKVWNALIEYNLENDILTFLDLAVRNEIPFLTSIPSILKLPIKKQSKKVLKFLGDRVDRDSIRRLALARDSEDKNALDYAFETQNEQVILLVEKLIGNDFTSEFPNIIQDQENQIKTNQESLHHNIHKLKEIDHAVRVSNLSDQSHTGSLLPTTLMMLSEEPTAFDPSKFPKRFSHSSQQSNNTIYTTKPTRNQSRPEKETNLDFESSFQDINDIQNNYLKNQRNKSTNVKLEPINYNKPNLTQNVNYPKPSTSSSFYNDEDDPISNYGDLGNNLESFVNGLVLRRKEEERRLKQQKEQGCHVS